MLKNKILLIFSNHRVAEKLWPIIPELSKTYKLDLFLIGLFSFKTPWVGDLDEREVYLNYYSKYFDKIINGPGIRYHGDRIDEELSQYIDINSYCLVIFDDNREMQEYSMPGLYEKFKLKNILVLGNSHGNEDYSKMNAGIHKSFDSVFSLGYKEKFIIENNFKIDPDNIFEGGIPQNDLLQSYVKSNKHILVITNFLGNRSSIFPVNFDSEFIEKIGLKKLEKKYKLPILIKQKTRLDDPEYQNNIKFISNLINATVVTNTNDINTLIAESAMVISAPSTLAFKSIQLGIPTVLIKGSGQVGNFYDYPGLVNSDYDEIDQSIELQKYSGKQTDFIEYTIAGGNEFKSSNIYVNTIKNILK
jgi:hypothetical protein